MVYSELSVILIQLDSYFCNIRGNRLKKHSSEFLGNHNNLCFNAFHPIIIICFLNKSEASWADIKKEIFRLMQKHQAFIIFTQA
jgi:hypothetical protein